MVNKTKTMNMKRFNSMMLAGFGVVLLAAHVLVVWGGIQLTGKIDRLLPWIAGGSLAAFALYHVVRRILGKGHSYSHLSGGTLHDRQEVERGPHGGVLVNLGHGFVEISIFKAGESPRFRLFFYDKNKQARSVPANATVRVETVRPDNTRQIFDFHAKD